MVFVVAKLEILEIHTGSIERALTLQKSFKLDAQFHGFQITRQYHPLLKSHQKEISINIYSASLIVQHTVDGSDPKQPPGMKETL